MVYFLPGILIHLKVVDAMVEVRVETGNKV
jgi:hypothetical protein